MHAEAEGGGGEGRAADRRGGPVTFQFADVRKMAAQILKKATDEAEAKLQAARAQIAELEKKAHEEGVARGLEEGRAKGEKEGRAAGTSAAREEFAEATGGVASMLEELLEGLDGLKLQLQAAAEADLLRLAVEIARLLVRREIRDDPGYLLPTLREAIRCCSDRSDLVLHIHPDDAAVIEAELERLHQAFRDLGRVSLAPDASLERGDLLLTGPGGEVDMRLAVQFAAIERALLGAEPEAPFLRPAAEVEAEAAAPEAEGAPRGELPPLAEAGAPIPGAATVAELGELPDDAPLPADPDAPAPAPSAVPSPPASGAAGEDADAGEDEARRGAEEAPAAPSGAADGGAAEPSGGEEPPPGAEETPPADTETHSADERGDGAAG